MGRTWKRLIFVLSFVGALSARAQDYPIKAGPGAGIAFFTNGNNNRGGFSSAGAFSLFGDLKVRDPIGSNFVTIKAPTLGVDWTLTLPTTAGSAGFLLSTNGSGVTSWITPPASSPLTTKGDLYTYDTGNQRLGVGTNGQVLKANSAQATGLEWAADIDTGITTLNTLTALTQTFATGTAGTDFGISSATSTHTFNLPTASATNRGALSSADWSTFDGKQNALSFGNLTAAGTDGIAVTGGTGAVIGAGTSIAQQAASTTLNGYLTSTDWNTFNNKQSALTFGSISTSTTGVTVGSGSNSTVGPNVTVDIQNATTGQPGLLTATDWNTFNGKENALTFSAPLSRSVNTISIPAATSSVDGYLTQGDWSTFNGKQAAGNYITALTGDVTASGPGSVAATIANSSVTNAKMANMAAHTFKGNNTAGSTAPIDLTQTELTAELNLFTSGLQGLVPASGGGTSNFLRADGTFAAPAGTSYTIGTINSQTKSANGAVITGSSLVMQEADATNNGLVSTGAQSIAGAKTFLSAPNLDSLTASLPLKLDGSKNITAAAIALGGSEVTGTLPETKGGTNQSTYTTGDILYASASNTLSKLAAGTDGHVLTLAAGIPSWAASGGGGGTITIFGSRGTPRSVVTATGITSGASHMSTSAMNQKIYVEGSVAGNSDISASPQISNGTVDGQEMLICGRNDSQTIQLDTGTGLSLNGSAVLGVDDCISLSWDTSVWVEVSRSF